MSINFGVFLFVISISLSIQNRNSTPEIQACLEYKTQIFEIKESFSFFVRDAPILTKTVDKCVSYEPFVVGGSPALPKEFPPMARLGNHEKNVTYWFCGGTLISEKFVLTAAHCFYTIYKTVNIVRLGELDFSQTNEDANPEDFGVKRLIKHPNYHDAASLYNDIGIIELDRHVVFDHYKHPACLPVNDGSDFNDFIAIGWGNTHFVGVPSERLLKVKLQRFNDDDCQEMTTMKSATNFFPKGLNTNSQICAGSSTIGDTCSGDSGGPLLAYHKQYPCLYFIIGLTSAGLEHCGSQNVPGIYTRVFHYMDWLRNYVFP